MRFERIKDILSLAIRLQGMRGGLTIADIQEEFSVSRRTAERMRNAVEAVFGPLETVETGDLRIHWRLHSAPLRQFIRVSPEELAELESAAGSLDHAGLAERAGGLRHLAVKLRALSHRHSPEEFESALEALMAAEGLAMRPGPKESLEEGLLSLVRDAATARRTLEFDYFSRTMGRRSRQRVRPYGVLYGNRAFLVGRADWANDTRLWRLANVSEARLADEVFERDPAFDLRSYAERSFGTFQEEPVEVVLLFDADAARDAKAFQFHPSQTAAENDGGSLTVRFKAGGIEEMCWHLVTWGGSVTVEQPALLRRRLAEMCASLAAHHRAECSDQETRS